MTTSPPIINDVITIPRNELIDPKINIIGLTKLALSEHLLKAGIEQKHLNMRLNQIWGWLYQKGITDFSKMGNISKDVKGLLSKYFSISLPAIVEKKISTDGTRKYLLRLSGGHEIETVFIPETDRGTLCISSQVGCTLTCPFCHTGTQKLVRNLNPSEMIGQVLIAREDLNEWPTEQNNRVGQPRKLSNIVLMGMGEPLYNFDAVRDAMNIAMDPAGIALSRRRITLSTSGVVPEIGKVGDEIGCMLAISFHATTDEVRNKLVPINKRWNISQLLQALRDYPRLSNSERITFEYVMIDKVNDSDEDARRLIALIKGIPAKINLIPFNEWPGAPYKRSSNNRIRAFADIIHNAGYSSPIRKPRGEDIMAACGQLKSETERARKSKAQIAKELINE
ncbi:MAG: 23S rRNA (adenine(2503)-C(2))-methyltransferase RlmN [Paracoccaceae bacterium]|nr:23S rRNA (adenine(2503)-C(2))-methyltransferase RlmN [Paracoccaceae bacterium]